MPADNWEHIINLVTGWTLPDRADIIDKSKGDGGIPWLNVSIKGVDNDRVAINSLHGDGNGATIQFWSGSGKGVKKHEANITFVGMEKGKQYWEASALVLRNLVYGNFSSANLNTSIPGAPSPEKGIDLHTFSQLAKSFDAAGNFFARHTEVIKQWAEALGSEQASWKGTAASAFWHMLDQLHTKYENYLSQLRPPGFTPANVSSSTGYVSTTLHGESLIGAEVALYKLVSDLYYYQQNFFWRRAAPIGITRPDSTTASFRAAADPRDILLELVRDITEWVGIHQAPFVYFEYTSMPTGDGGYAAYDTVTTLPGFQESTHWGALKDTSTWGGIANEAVSRWRDNVSKNLDELAIPSVAVLQKEWSRVLDPNWNTKFTFGDTTSGGLSAIVEREKADADKDKAAREADERSKEQQADADRRAAAAQKDADERYKK
ncbi:AAWKG family protein, partial [Streptomyces sp. NPDC002755]